MDEKTTYWASIGLGGAALLLLIINMSLINGNRQLQEEISQRGIEIDKSMTFDQVDKGIANALASIAIQNNDGDARSLLAAQGITIPPQAKASEAPKDAKESKKKSTKSDDE